MLDSIVNCATKKEGKQRQSEVNTIYVGRRRTMLIKEKPTLYLLPAASINNIPGHAHRRSMATVSVIIPALNEAKNLPFVLPRIPSWVEEVFLINGNSTDDTAEVARQVYPNIRVIPQSGMGKGAALQTGFKAATGEYIIMLDADGSTDPAEIPEFCAILGNADFVKGSRFMQGGGTADMEVIRKIGNSCLRILVRLLYGGSFSDLCYGYIGFRRSVLPALHIDADGFEVETLMNLRALRAGLRVAEVPSYEYRRLSGTSHLRTLRDGWRVLRTIIKERFHDLPVQRPRITPVFIEEKAQVEEFEGKPESEWSIQDTHNFPNSYLSKEFFKGTL